MGFLSQSTFLIYFTGTLICVLSRTLYAPWLLTNGPKIQMNNEMRYTVSFDLRCCQL